MPEYFEIVFIKKPTITAGQEIATCLTELGIKYGRHRTREHFSSELAPNVSLAVTVDEIAANYLTKTRLRQFPIVFRRSPDDGSVTVDYHVDAKGFFE